MTGPQHYQEAERLVAGVLEGRYDESERPGSELLAIAAVHVTLAQAAATALGASLADSRAWIEAAGTKLSRVGHLRDPAHRGSHRGACRTRSSWRSMRVGIRNSAFGHCAFSIRGARDANRCKQNTRHPTIRLSHDPL